MKEREFEAVAMIANNVDKNGIMISSEACQDVVDQINQNSFPLLWNFDSSEPPIGRVVSARLEDNKVIVRVQISNLTPDSIKEHLTSLFAGPQLFVKGKVEQDEIQNIHSVDLACMSVFAMHADNEATPLVEIKEKGGGENG